MTAWQAAVISQVILVLFYVRPGSWQSVVSASPSSIFEYMPGGPPANSSTVALCVAFGLVWLAVLCSTLLGKRIGLLAGTVLGLFGVLGAISGFATEWFGAPDFSAFLFFPVSILGIVSCAIAWRSPR